MRIRTSAIILGTALLFGCGQNEKIQSGSEIHADAVAAVEAAEELMKDFSKSGNPERYPDVAEALFRHQFENNASGRQSSVGAFCLAFAKETSPSPQFMSRFAAEEIAVKAVGKCKWIENHWTDGDGGNSIVFYINDIVCEDKEICRATGGYSEASLSASGNNYELKLQDSRWTVVKDEMLWIS